MTTTATYSPVILCSTAAVSEEEWLRWRTKRELDYLIKHGQLDIGDFNFEVIDDNDDHEIED